VVTVASRCKTCGQFTSEPHDHRPKLEDFCITPEQAHRDKQRLSGTVVSEDPGRGELLEKIREAAKTAGQKPVKRRWWRRRPTGVR
jgi:hypothetical protein